MFFSQEAFWSPIPGGVPLRNPSDQFHPWEHVEIASGTVAKPQGSALFRVLFVLAIGLLGVWVSTANGIDRCEWAGSAQETASPMRILEQLSHSR